MLCQRHAFANGKSMHMDNDSMKDGKEKIDQPRSLPLRDAPRSRDALAPEHVEEPLGEDYEQGAAA